MTVSIWEITVSMMDILSLWSAKPGGRRGKQHHLGHAREVMTPSSQKQLSSFMLVMQGQEHTRCSVITWRSSQQTRVNNFEGTFSWLRPHRDERAARTGVLDVEPSGSYSPRHRVTLDSMNNRSSCV